MRYCYNALDKFETYRAIVETVVKTSNPSPSGEELKGPR